MCVFLFFFFFFFFFFRPFLATPVQVAPLRVSVPADNEKYRALCSFAILSRRTAASHFPPSLEKQTNVRVALFPVWPRGRVRGVSKGTWLRIPQTSLCRSIGIGTRGSKARAEREFREYFIRSGSHSARGERARPASARDLDFLSRQQVDPLFRISLPPVAWKFRRKTLTLHDRRGWEGISFQTSFSFFFFFFFFFFPRRPNPRTYNFSFHPLSRRVVPPFQPRLGSRVLLFRYHAHAPPTSYHYELLWFTVTEQCTCKSTANRPALYEIYFGIQIGER